MKSIQAGEIASSKIPRQEAETENRTFARQ